MNKIYFLLLIVPSFSFAQNIDLNKGIIQEDSYIRNTIWILIWKKS
jgi:hypothetical protein